MPETHIASGKVRDIYEIDPDHEEGGRLLLVASDRISTFDVVLPTEIPDKGRVLTGLSGYWFTVLAPIVPNHMLDRLAWLVEGLVVRPERMRRNLEASHFLFFSQRVLNALVESGLARDDAYRLVQRAAMRAWEEELDFRELCRTDEEMASRVDLGSAFDLGAYTRHVDTVFARLEALKEEPLHA